ncbi:hypothetical protein [Thioclava nitratireducens]|uniref:hypothetical protein n=1 Tax=Thioclava nitratireducens TaxID=1915078 RepID=UPI0024497374|nr:hypothetical protein [Thioclava nitratireducens]
MCQSDDIETGSAIGKLPERASGHLGLGKLNFLYDDNGITIDGLTDLRVLLGRRSGAACGLRLACVPLRRA